MFLARSAFWLSLVYAHMPLDGGEIVRAVDDTRSAVIANAATTARAKCTEDAASCRAILSAAAGAMLSPAAEPTRPRASTPAKGARPSANSLSAADLAAPWRGRPTKPGG
jgi:hypothetical protein